MAQLETNKIVRVEVIDADGRRVVLHARETKFDLSVQDNGATLKVLILGKLRLVK